MDGWGLREGVGDGWEVGVSTSVGRLVCRSAGGTFRACGLRGLDRDGKGTRIVDKEQGLWIIF